MKRGVSILLCFVLLLSACSSGSAMTWDEQYELGLRYLEEGKYEDAVIAFQNAIQIDPKRAEAYIGLADVYIAQGDEEKAAQILQDALEVVSDPSSIQTKLDEIEEAPPDTSGATSSSDSSEQGSGSESEANPAGSESEAPTWQGLYDQGMDCLQSGDFQGAIDAFNAAVELDPTRAEAYIGLADAYVGLGDTDRAIQILEDALNVVTDTEAIQRKLDELRPQPEPVVNQIPGSNIFWELSNGTLTLTGSGDFPEFWEDDHSGGYGDGPAPWFSVRDEIQSIVIGDDITNIGSYTFSGCSSLTSVTFGKSIDYFGIGTFAGCTSLKSITIPEGLTRGVGAYSFSGCTALTSVTFPQDSDGVTVGVFTGCSSLTSVVMPEGATGIGLWAFSGCSSLTSITIPASVDTIGMSAFSGCDSLTDIYYGGTEEAWKSALQEPTDIPESTVIHFNS